MKLVKKWSAIILKHLYNFQISSLLSHSDERIMTEGLALIELILNCASHKTLEQISDHLENEEHNLFAALQGLLCQTIATFQERFVAVQ